MMLNEEPATAKIFLRNYKDRMDPLKTPDMLVYNDKEVSPLYVLHKSKANIF